MEKLKIGDHLWNGGSPMMKYIVKAEIKREKNIQYEIECLSCRGHENCRLLITLDDNKRYKYVAIINENEHDRQYYVHLNNGFFHTTKEKAEIEKLEGYIKLFNKHIKEAEEKLEYNKKEKIKCEETLKSYKELLEKKL